MSKWMCGSMIFTEKILKPMNKPAKQLRGKSGGCIVNATQFGNPVALSVVEGTVEPVGRRKASGSLPPCTLRTLYDGVPVALSMKSALRMKSFHDEVVS